MPFHVPSGQLVCHQLRELVKLEPIGESSTAITERRLRLNCAFEQFRILSNYPWAGDLKRKILSHINYKVCYVTDGAAHVSQQRLFSLTFSPILEHIP